jgi:hypothetical protein
MFVSGASRWILAFDASCGTCRNISHAVEQAAEGRLSVVPLQDPEVVRWRTAALGNDAPLVPTLLRVSGDGKAEGWISRAMALPLVRLLGVRATLRVFAALGRLSEEAREPLSAPSPARGLSRKAFLRLSAGATVAGGIVFGGKVPAFAEQRRSAAAAWVTANETRLPQTLDGFVGFPQIYQQEIYLALAPAQRAGLWREHVAAFRATHPAWNELQRRAYESVERMLANDNMFDFDQFGQHASAFEKMQVTATDAFGVDRARQLIATLGPEDKTKVLAEGCSCSRESDLCGVAPWNCGYTAPACQERRGCGAGWVFICNGHCFY